MDRQPVLVGRERERSALRAVVVDAATGQPGLLLVHGEAGIGKTSLVREAAAVARAEGSHVLLGQCLRFGADVTSYLPFTQALTHWLRTSESDLRTRLATTGRLDDLVPALSNGAQGVALLQLGEVLDALQADRPTVVVLDDLQWADPSSLDVLSYLVAGFAPGGRLAVLATYRDTDLGEGHRLHGWLADADRMPGVARLELARMDVWAIEEMLLARGVTRADGVTAREVLRRSGGNPYLASLLMDDPGPEGSFGAAPGGHLAEALLASWHRLSAPGRRVMQVLAVAGAPVALPVLHELAARFGPEPEEAVGAVRESAAEGVTIRTETGAIWFRHPLLAETIAATLSRWEVAALHADFATAWEAAVDVDERDRANALALHHVASGDRDRSVHWLLRAADEAQAIRSWDEVASHLSTAVSLMDTPGTTGARDGHLDLLVRAAKACETAGDDRGAVRHYEAALEMVDRRVDPLLASRILLELHILRDLAGYGTTHLSLAEPREVLHLTEATPGAPERALGHAQLAFAEVFNGEPAAVEHAETAVRLAEEGDDRRALTWALAVRAQTRWGTEDGVSDGERALALAVEADDPQLVCRCAIFLSNSYQSTGRYAESAAVTHRSYRSLLDQGQFDYAASVGAQAAWWDFVLGHWDEARPLVRELLTVARSDSTAGAARNVAALLAAHEGNAQASALHLRRAKELLPTAAPVGDTLTATEVLVSIVTGDPLHALELIEGCMAEAVQIDALAADEYLEYASRAAFALADEGPASPERLTAQRSFARIEAARAAGPAPFVPAGPHDAVHPALGALHAAQRAQFLGHRDRLPALWEAACVATEQAGMQFEHARALHALARHLLVRRLDRKRATALLAKARDIAVGLGARPLVHDIDALALQSHLTLTATPPGEAPDPGRTTTFQAHPPLTSREQQVLEGVVAGETYAQIADRLFITDKTVSTHVSNLLRKTGTSSRIELADLANRAQEAPRG